MRKSVIPPTIVTLLAILSCNAPTRPTTLPATEDLPPVATSPPVETETSEPTFELPDIAGTVNAEESDTPDPGQKAHIRGAIRYPSEGNPAMRVFALATNGQYYQFVSTIQNQGSYEIEVPPGEYYVLADLDASPGFEAGYTVVGQCLAEHNLQYDSCPNQDHSLVAVHVLPGQSIEAIDMIDWFPSDGTFPPVP